MVYNGIQWYTMVYNGIQWYTIQLLIMPPLKIAEKDQDYHDDSDVIFRHLKHRHRQPQGPCELPRKIVV